MTIVGEVKIKPEFAVILCDIQSLGHLSDVFERIQRNISQNS